MVGKLVSVVGPMFAWKTSRLFELIEKEVFSKREFIVFNSDLDSRYGKDKICTHSGLSFPAYFISESKEMKGILEFTDKDIKSCFIDEVQFFDEGILDFISYALLTGVNVFTFGLNLTAEGKPFPFRNSTKHVGELLAISDEVEILKGICSECGNKSSRSYFIGESKKNAIKVGNSDYVPLCSNCWHGKNPK